MNRRNFLIVDDIPQAARNVDNHILRFYQDRKILNFNTKIYSNETCFSDALNFINEYASDIDIIFSDFNLRTRSGKSGLDLFDACSRLHQTAYDSLGLKTSIFKVLHSNEDGRFKQHQGEYKKKYHHFVNSDVEKDIENFLSLYEMEIGEIINSGNPLYKSIIYSLSKTHALTDTHIWLGNKQVLLKDVILTVRDISDGKGEYYHFYYYDSFKICATLQSVKPTPAFNEVLRALHFISGNFQFDSNQKFKLNPLWVSRIDFNNSVIKTIPRFSVQMIVKFKNVDYSKSDLINPKLPEFFTL